MDALYRWDVEVFRAIHIGLHSAVLDPIFFVLTWMGDGGVQAALIFAGLLTKPGRRWFWPLMVTLLAGGIGGAQGLKHLIPRDRPSNLPFAHPQEPLFGNSFPSGHTTSSVALAVMLILLTQGTRQSWLGWTTLVLAGFIGLSRIYRGVHWPSDVLGGAFCGALFACLVYLAFSKSKFVAPD